MRQCTECESHSQYLRLGRSATNSFDLQKEENECMCSVNIFLIIIALIILFTAITTFYKLW